MHLLKNIGDVTAICCRGSLFMPNKINLIGLCFGRLKVINESSNRSIGGGVMWECVCECGISKEILGASLRSGRTTSCGCYSRKRVTETHTNHGQSTRKGRSITYISWDAMIQRCTNKKCKYYDNYGGRGIKVCERWLNSFDNFYLDMGQRPSKKHTLDRFPNINGNYELGNCRWGTSTQQSRNRRSNIWIEYNGEKLILTDWANKIGARLSIIRRSIQRGKSFEEIYLFYKNKNNG